MDTSAVGEDEDEMEPYAFPLANNVNTEGNKALDVTIPKWQDSIEQFRK
jgi:hypothetical protein